MLIEGIVVDKRQGLLAQGMQWRIGYTGKLTERKERIPKCNVLQMLQSVFHDNTTISFSLSSTLRINHRLRPRSHDAVPLLFTDPRLT